MPPDALTRARPAILLLAGAAAAYATYLVLGLQNTTSDGLRRSNAVRRPPARSRRDESSTRVLASIIERIDRDPLGLGTYTYFGTSLLLDPRLLPSTSELVSLAVNAEAMPSDSEVHRLALVEMFDVLLDRLLMRITPNTLPSPAELQALSRWIGHRIPDGTAISRATNRHAQRVGVPLLAEAADSVALTDQSWPSDDESEADAEGQTLQRALYHIAEERARHEGVIHHRITCNACDEKPIRGTRWHCANCVDFDLCSNCEATNSHNKTHIFYKIRVPAPYLSLQTIEPLYPGRPQSMTHSIDPLLKRKLVSETKMEPEKVEALWDQFTCLASSEWPRDPNGVKCALDRRAFNQAIIPRFKSFIAAPNLIYDRLFAFYDTDENGLIGFEEFVKGLDALHSSDMGVRARIIFNGYDLNGDGYISRRDVLRIFRAYYAIEKEATRNHVAEVTEEFSIRNALDTIDSSQPLGSAFPPNHLPNATENAHLRDKPRDDFAHTLPAVRESTSDTARREEMILRTDARTFIRSNDHADQEARIISERWARRRFYVDEEEGLSRPLGPNASTSATGATNDTDGTFEDSAPPPEGERPRLSRSSSRVRFEDDVDFDARSNASTSSRPVGERWGGYEIPEPEKDLGKEVLYQITQRAFNELLDPLFLEYEDNAMDIENTRIERKRNGPGLEQAMEILDRRKNENLAVLSVGIFRYARRLVEQFCEAVNQGTEYEGLKAMCLNQDGTQADCNLVRSRLQKVYDLAETSVLLSIDISEYQQSDDLPLWNILLCRDRLKDEILISALRCAVWADWLPEGDPVHGEASPPPVPPPPPHHDPTLPQFRPNAVETTADQGGSDTSSLFYLSDSSSSVTPPNSLSRHGEPHERLYAHPHGPFFVFAPTPKDIEHLVSTTEAATTASATDAPRTRPAPNMRTPSNHPAEWLQDRPPTPSQASQDMQLADLTPFTWSNCSDDPTIHFFYLDPQPPLAPLSHSSSTARPASSPTSGPSSQLRAGSRPALHSARGRHSSNPVRPLMRHLRNLAANPMAAMYFIYLASLEMEEKRIAEGVGGRAGEIGFEEFEKALGERKWLGGWVELGGF